MSAYRAGLATGNHRPRRTAYQAGVVVGFRLGNFPGYVLDEIERLDSEVASTGADMRAELEAGACHYVRDAGTWGDPLTNGEIARTAADRQAMASNSEPCRSMAEFYSGPWGRFAERWAEFREDHNSGGISGWAERFWGGSLMETVDSYRTQLAGMQDAARKAGFGVRVPAPTTGRAGLVDRVTDAPGNAIQGLGDIVKLVIWAVIGMGGFLLLSLFLRGGTVGGGKLLAVRSAA